MQVDFLLCAVARGRAKFSILFRVPAVRVLAMFIALGVLGFCVRFAPVATSNLLFLLVAIVTSTNSYEWFRRVRWPSKWTWIRLVRRIRKGVHPPPLAVAMYSAVLPISTFSLVFSSWLSQPYILMVGSVIGVVALCLASTLDAWHRLRNAWKVDALRFALKWVGLFVATVVIFGATILAKNIAHMISHVDPKYLPDFVLLATAAAYPFVLASVLSFFLLLVLTMQYLLLFLCLPLFMVGQTLINSLIGERREKIKSLLYRLWSGHKPLRSRRWWVNAFAGFEYFLRPVGTGALATGLIAFLVYGFTLTGPIAEKYLPQLLVFVEYRPMSSCVGLPADAQVVYLDRGFVSVAKKNTTGYAFAIQKCEIGTFSP